MHRTRAVFLAATLALAAPAAAHFQQLIPTTDIVPDEGDRTVSLTLTLTHPVEGGPVMDMGEPVAFGVLGEGQKVDLRSSLSPKTIDGKQAFEATYRFGRPGDYVFYLNPAPYWDAAEKQFLIHHTKVVVDFGAGDQWDALVGAPLEILPLTRPYGLWTGNLFRAIALQDGRPLPFARVEIEWINDQKIKVPSDPFTTQVVKADQNGVFAYGIPRAGWWGFNVVVDGKLTRPDGTQADAEIGGTMWVKAVDLK